VLQALATVAPPEIAAAAAASPAWQVMAYAAGLAIASAAIFALVPAWRAAAGATRWLRQRSDTGDRGSAVMRLGLVTSQIAAAGILLTGAALLISSLSRVMQVNPGFRPDGALTFDVSLPDARYDTFAKRQAAVQALSERLSALPGVSAVCAINEIPFDSEGGMTYVPDSGTRPIGASPRTVTAGCLDALGIPVLRGRGFGPNEHGGAVIVSEAFAKSAWPGEDPVGKHLHMGVATGSLVEVVGVASDILSNSLEARAYPQVYQAWTDEAWFGVSHMIVRAAVRPGTLFPSIRAAVRAVDPDQPVANLRTMNEVIQATTASRRFNLTLLGSFALVALLLSAVGVYGLLSQVVAQRTPEIGLRLALGATPRSTVKLMLRHAALALSIAIPVGVGGALFASRLLRRFMCRMSETDAMIYSAVAVTLVLIVLAAAWLPARRAAEVDPALTMK
jgi:predicted permease